VVNNRGKGRPTDWAQVTAVLLDQSAINEHPTSAVRHSQPARSDL
jgi:hypothetical protein